MHTPSNLEHGVDPADRPESDVFAAAHRMIELAERAAPNLSATRELSVRAMSMFASDLETIRVSLERLAGNPADLLAAANLDRAMSMLDQTMSVRLWALDAAAADEWRACRRVALQHCHGRREVRVHVGRHHRLSFPGLREWGRSLL